MSAKKVTVLARVRAKTGMEDKVRDAVMALVGPTRQEAGCINYDLHRSLDDSATLFLYENWISKEDLDTHLQMPYLKDFLGKADELLAEPVNITLWEMISEPEK